MVPCSMRVPTFHVHSLSPVPTWRTQPSPRPPSLPTFVFRPVSLPSSLLLLLAVAPCMSRAHTHTCGAVCVCAMGVAASRHLVRRRRDGHSRRMLAQ